MIIEKLLRKIAGRFGYNAEIRKKGVIPIPSDFESLHTGIYSQCKPYTMTSPERIYSVIEAIKYIERKKIEGCVVECGVWKGGSMMAAALTLQHLNTVNRDLYLFDTFEGMPPAGNVDENYSGEKANKILEKESNEKLTSVNWAYSTIDEVKNNIYSTGYPVNRIHLIKGKVENTITTDFRKPIALLRLDTDWYESTNHEMEYLFPLLQPGGVLIIDDYGFWKGARKAIDEYLVKNQLNYFLHRIDNTGRMIIK